MDDAAPCVGGGGRPPLTKYFTARRRELAAVGDVLREHCCAVVSHPDGVGKTQLALAFADLVERGGEVPGGVHWVAAHGRLPRVVDALAAFAERLLGARMPHDIRMSFSAVAVAVVRGLSARRGRWLLVLDDLEIGDELSPLYDAVCDVGDEGRLLITTRRAKAARWSCMKESQMVTLQPLSQEASMCCVMRVVRDTEVQAADDEVVRSDLRRMQKEKPMEHRALEELCNYDAFGGQLVALVHRAAYIRQFGCTFVDCVSSCASERTLMSTWKLTIERLSDGARRVVRTLSFFADNAIPESLLACVMEMTPDCTFRKVVIEELLHLSLLSETIDDNGNAAFTWHRELRQMVNNSMEHTFQDRTVAYNSALLAAHGCVKQLLEKGGNSYAELPEEFDSAHRPLVDHLMCMVLGFRPSPKSTWESINLPELRDVHEYVGRALMSGGRIDEAIVVCEQLLGLLRRVSGDGARNEAVGNALNLLSDAYREAGRLEEALLMVGECVETRRHVHGQDSNHPAIAESLGKLGIVYREQGKLEEAATMFSASLDMNRAIHGSDAVHPSLASTLGDLGSVYRELDLPDDAVTTFVECVRMNLAIYGYNASHPTLAAALSNLAVAFREQGKLDEAGVILNKCLKMLRAIYGADAVHPKVADAQGNLGIVYERQGKLDDSVAMLCEAIRTLRALHGPKSSHLTIAVTLNNLGIVYRQGRKLDEAAEALLECLKMKRAIYGQEANHESIAVTLNNLGDVYEKQGKLEEAASFLSECLNMERAIHRLTVGGPSASSKTM